MKSYLPRLAFFRSHICPLGSSRVDSYHNLLSQAAPQDPDSSPPGFSCRFQIW